LYITDYCHTVLKIQIFMQFSSGFLNFRHKICPIQEKLSVYKKTYNTKICGHLLCPIKTSGSNLLNSALWHTVCAHGVSFNVHHNHKTLSRFNDKQLSRITVGSDFALRVPKPLFCLLHLGVAFRTRYDITEVFLRTKSSGTLLTALVPSSFGSSSAA